jgi:hypothetical protein
VKNRFQSLPFKFNLQRYSAAQLQDELVTKCTEMDMMRRGCNFTPLSRSFTPSCSYRTSWIQLTHSLKTPGFNPWAYKVKTRFQAFAFKWVNLYRYDEGGVPGADWLLDEHVEEPRPRRGQSGLAGAFAGRHLVQAQAGKPPARTQLGGGLYVQADSSLPIACESAWFLPLSQRLVSNPWRLYCWKPGFNILLSNGSKLVCRYGPGRVKALEKELAYFKVGGCTSRIQLTRVQLTHSLKAHLVSTLEQEMWFPDFKVSKSKISKLKDFKFETCAAYIEERHGHDVARLEEMEVRLRDQAAVGGAVQLESSLTHSARNHPVSNNPLSLWGENLVSSLCFFKMQLVPLRRGRRGAQGGAAQVECSWLIAFESALVSTLEPMKWKPGFKVCFHKMQLAPLHQGATRHVQAASDRGRGNNRRGRRRAGAAEAAGRQQVGPSLPGSDKSLMWRASSSLVEFVRPPPPPVTWTMLTVINWTAFWLQNNVVKSANPTNRRLVALLERTAEFKRLVQDTAELKGVHYVALSEVGFALFTTFVILQSKTRFN